MIFLSSMEISLVNKIDLLAYCHQTGTRPPSCVTPRQLNIHPIVSKVTILQIKVAEIQCLLGRVCDCSSLMILHYTQSQCSLVKNLALSYTHFCHHFGTKYFNVYKFLVDIHKRHIHRLNCFNPAATIFEKSVNNVDDAYCSSLLFTDVVSQRK